MLNMNMKKMKMPHVNTNLPKAQAIKDATMAHFILENWSENHLFFHLNGSYHSDNYQGIIWYIRQKNKEVKIKTVSSVYQSDIHSLGEQNKGIADYIICVDENMTKTH